MPENCNIQQDEDEWRDSECFNLSAFNGFSLQEQFILSEDTVLESRMSSTVEPVVEVGKEQVCKDKRYWLRPRQTASNVQPAKAYKPTTKPRKHVLITSKERNDISYNRLRQRNKLASRKWRFKMKEKQKMKDEQLDIALIELDILKEELRIIRAKLSRCHCQQGVLPSAV